MRSVALGPKRARGGVALIFTAAECKPASLTVGLRENDSDAWSPIQQWLLQLRRRSISVLNVHHAGKTGGQRGSADKSTQSAYADCYAGIAVKLAQTKRLGCPLTDPCQFGILQFGSDWQKTECNSMG